MNRIRAQVGHCQAFSPGSGLPFPKPRVFGQGSPEPFHPFIFCQGRGPQGQPSGLPAFLSAACSAGEVAE
jgi:hypothetical protein